MTPPRLAMHLKERLKPQVFGLKVYRKRVRRYEGIPGHDEPYKLRGSMNVWQECVRQRAVKDRAYILYSAMMSMRPGVSQIYTPHC